MKRCWTLTIALMVAAGAATGRADNNKDADKKDDEVAKAMSKIAQLGPGVYAVKKDDQGRIKTCVVVGEARISTVLGKAQGLETARTRARLAAAAEFRKWLNEKLTVYEKSESETITLIEGAAGGDKDVLKESGKAVEKTTKRYETVADGLVKGLQVLHVEVSGDDKTYTVVLGWDAETAKAAGTVDGDGKKEGGKEGDARKDGDKKIDSKSVTSDDAKKFIK
jgi:hypothetical protein